MGADAGCALGIGGSIAVRAVGGEGRYQGILFAKFIEVCDLPRAVLGRQDFMRAFDVRFCWSRKPPEFFIEPADSQAEPRRRS
jgi:hypothetical protein